MSWETIILYVDYIQYNKYWNYISSLSQTKWWRTGPSCRGQSVIMALSFFSYHNIEILIFTFHRRICLFSLCVNPERISPQSWQSEMPNSTVSAPLKRKRIDQEERTKRILMGFVICSLLLCQECCLTTTWIQTVALYTDYMVRG